MGDLKTRLSNVRTKLLRKNTTDGQHQRLPTVADFARRSASLTELRKSKTDTPHSTPSKSSTFKDDVHPSPSPDHDRHREADESIAARRAGSESVQSSREVRTVGSSTISIPSPTDPGHDAPFVMVQGPTPDTKPPASIPFNSPATKAFPDGLALNPSPSPRPQASPRAEPKSFAAVSKSPQLSVTEIRPTAHTIRKQSLIDRSNTQFIHSLLSPDSHSIPETDGRDYFPPGDAPMAHMLHRKIWVKRPGASATLVQVREDDLVDDARDSILRKYGNSLGRHFDAPDVTLSITSRDHSARPSQRVLGPDEELCRTLDTAYPGGQTVDEALLIDVPQKRTPKPSPRTHMHHDYYSELHTRPTENGTDYFPPMPLAAPSPAGMTNTSHDSRHSNREAHDRALSVLSTGQVPPLPSPGSTRRHHHKSRPNAGRTHTSSPTTFQAAAVTRPNRPRVDSSASDSKHPSPAAAPVPTPPAPDVQAAPVAKQSSEPPTPRVSSPRPRNRKAKNKSARETPALPPGILDTSVPPINVLIVEDNHINMKLLEQFIRRLKVRWQTAVNGREAVDKWRQGGFHLVLMDIQLPIMSGLEATKEIRRLERVNNIGVFSSGSSEAPSPLGEIGRLDEAVVGGDVEEEAKVNGEEEKGEVKEDDKLGDDLRLFKSPVIIVALTASNLQSDRHEALAAGCNDFLTKPVNFVWFERKVKEWGCMQALIDFDGWRKWKDFTNAADKKAAAANNAAGALTLKAGKKAEKDAKDAKALRKLIKGEKGNVPSPVPEEEKESGESGSGVEGVGGSGP